MEVAQPASIRAVSLARPGRPGSGVTDGLAVEVGQDFPTLIIDAEHARRAGEPDGLQMTQQRMNGQRMRTGSSADRLPNAYGAIVTAPAGQPMRHALGA